ncbi:MAG TPA: hypothetical protein VKM54_27260 [Myxococcota bacterium]|nr:hypothetical protein [Myxococcota bacterium]
MADSEPFQLVLEGGAKKAVSEIAELLRKDKDEAVERALGTELYLLEKVTNEKARVFLEYSDGTRSEVNLLG